MYTCTHGCSAVHTCKSYMLVYYADLTCPGDPVYTYTGNRCPNVCGLPVNSIWCASTADRDGCACPAGGYRGAGMSCVPPADCGCSDPSDGSYHMVRLDGESVDHKLGMRKVYDSVCMPPAYMRAYVCLQHI